MPTPDPASNEARREGPDGRGRLRRRLVMALIGGLALVPGLMAVAPGTAGAARWGNYRQPQSTVYDILMCARVRYRRYGALFLRRIGWGYPSSLTPSSCKQGFG